MRTYQREPDTASPRSHPWTDAAGNPANRYHDLKASPALIRTALEDFTPWSAWPAVECFFKLLEWLNGPDSPFESNDCAFSGPEPNESAEFAKQLAATGRLMIFWRDIRRNLARAEIEELQLRFHEALEEMDPGFEWGAVGTGLAATRYLAIPRASEQLGLELMLSFWAWGDTERETMENLERTLRNMSAALRSLSDR